MPAPLGPPEKASTSNLFFERMEMERLGIDLGAHVGSKMHLKSKPGASQDALTTPFLLEAVFGTILGSFGPPGTSKIVLPSKEPFLATF